MSPELRKFIVSVLDDDAGISEESMTALIELGEGDTVFNESIRPFIECCDGRYFVPADWIFDGD